MIRLLRLSLIWLLWLSLIWLICLLLPSSRLVSAEIYIFCIDDHAVMLHAVLIRVIIILHGTLHMYHLTFMEVIADKFRLASPASHVKKIRLIFFSFLHFAVHSN